MVSDSEEDVSLYDSELSESYYTDDDDDDDDYAGAESEDDDFYRPQKPYTALVEGDIRQRQDEEISHVSATLSVSTVAASLLLYHYKWNVSQLHDAWFGDEERVRATVGLLDTDSTPRKRDQEEELICGICFELCPWDQIYPTGCGHPYCKMCWKGYITASINDGPGCLSLRCPDPSCGAAVGQDMVDELASNEEKQKYSRFFLRSFIEEKKNTKWCPSPGCENAVEFEFGSSVYDVTCLCSCTFCWNCTEDAHRPVDCDTVAKWVLKNSSESENTDWIIANSKPCPKCKRPIEKDHGCMHMTCTQPCGFQFCWLCLGAWDDHDEKTGGFYACNKYETEKLQGLHSEDDNRREIAKKSSGKYTHYYERWASNQQSRQKAMKDLQETQTVQLRKLSDRVKIPEPQLGFILEAWQQIIECRRVLKWTYAYGYYLPEDEGAKKQLFEYLQGEAETALERLHHCVETELLRDFIIDEPEKDFNGFQVRLLDLTKATHSFFENLVRALENGLSDVDSQAVRNSEAGMEKGSTSQSDQPGVVRDQAVCNSEAGMEKGSDLDNHCNHANPDTATS